MSNESNAVADAIAADLKARAIAAATEAARELFARHGNPEELSRSQLEWTATIANIYQEALIVGYLQGVTAGTRDTMRVVRGVLDRATARGRVVGH